MPEVWQDGVTPADDLVSMRDWCRSVTPEERLHEALDMGDATSVVIHLKHFARTLHSVAMMAPAQVLTQPPVVVSSNCAYAVLIVLLPTQQ